MKKLLFTLLALMVLIPASIVHASYTGPGNRTGISTSMIVRTQCWMTQYCDTCAEVWRWRDWDGAYAAPGSALALQWQALYPNHNEHEHCWSMEEAHYAWGTKTVNMGSYDPVSTSAGLTCATPGNAGWCRSGLTLTMSATEPIPGYNIRRFDNPSGVLCNPADAPSVTCNAAITQEGAHSSNFWALSSFGDTSARHAYSWNLDSAPPAMAYGTSSQPSSSGWHRSNVAVSFSGTDTTSGIASSTYRYRIDGGAWQTGSGLSITTDGVYTITAEVQDVAGNTGGGSVTVRLDKAPPTTNPTITGTLNNGWYRFNPTVSGNPHDNTSGVASAECRQNGGAWQNCTFAPMIGITTDGTHTLEFRATDNAGNVSAVGSVTLQRDNTLPNISPSVPAPGGSNGWHTANVAVTLPASDAMSGIAPGTLRHRINGGSWVTGSNLSITSDGTHTVDAQVLDVAGNTRDITFTVRRDTVAPTLTTSAPSGWINTSGTASATASDATSGLAASQYRINGGAWVTGTSVSIATEGAYSVDFRATDNAGLATTRTETFSVDRTLPVLTSSVPAPGGSNGWHIANVAASLSASDALSGLAPGTLRHRINGGSWVTGSNLSIGTDGTHTVDAQVQDVAGNTRDITFTVRRDTVAPTLTTFAPSGWINASGTASATASDATSGVASAQYRVNGGAWQTGTSVSIATEGTHSVDFRATDNAGHERTRSETVRVDLTPPTVAAHPDPDGLNGWYASNPVIPIAANDALSGVAPGSVAYRLNGAATWTTGNSLSITEDGTHTVNLRANDLAGNSGTSSFNARVDTTPPTLTIDVSSAVPVQNGWYVEPATAGAVASDATSGVGLVEYRVENAVASTARAGRFSPAPQSAWVTGDNLTLTDGDHQVTMRVTDRAGHQTVTSERVRVDLTPPTSTFAVVEGPISGETALAGTSFDAHAGVSLVEYSFDDGLTWETVAHTGGEWAVPFDTTSRPDGEYTIMVRATDNAGHVETAPTSLMVTVNNKPPLPLMTESWWIWESGQLAVQPGVTPLGEISLQVTCGSSQPDVRLTYKDLAKLPPEFTWNRRCGDGHLAPPGDYKVTLTACNIYGKCDFAVGMIRVPEGQVVLTPTAEPTDEPQPEATPTSKPVSLPAAPPPAPPVEIVTVIAEAIPEIVESMSLWLLPLAGIVGSLAALGLNQLRDPRPTAIRKLGSLLVRRDDE